jgi:hypothetical protein
LLQLRCCFLLRKRDRAKILLDEVRCLGLLLISGLGWRGVAPKNLPCCWLLLGCFRLGLLRGLLCCCPGLLQVSCWFCLHILRLGLLRGLLRCCRGLLPVRCWFLLLSKLAMVRRTALLDEVPCCRLGWRSVALKNCCWLLRGRCWGRLRCFLLACRLSGPRALQRWWRRSALQELVRDLLVDCRCCCCCCCCCCWGWSFTLKQGPCDWGALRGRHEHCFGAARSCIRGEKQSILTIMHRVHGCSCKLQMLIPGGLAAV